jgi:uncharacterized protein YuzE
MNKHQQITYEQEDDVLNIWFSKKPIDYAEQFDTSIVHYTKDGEAVYIEILNASQLLKNLNKALPKKVREEIFSHPTSVAHRIK